MPETGVVNHKFLPEAWSSLTRVLGAAGAARALRCATLALLALGFLLRARGYLFSTIPLSLDEADWALRLFEQPLAEHLIRPPGFMALSKALTAMVSRSEAGLRFIPWGAGVAALFMAPALARRLFKSAGAQLFCVAAIALQPAAIDLSKEFKPYSLGFFLHLLLILLVLRYVSSKKGSDLAWLLAVALPAVLFSQDIIFAYPAVFLIPALEALRARNTRHLVATALMGLASFALVLLLYVFIWSRLDMKAETPYWGHKYDVFYVGESRGALAHVGWFFDRYLDITHLPAQRAEVWTSPALSSATLSQVRRVDLYVWFALHVVGLIVIVVRRRFREGALLYSPFLVLVAANFLGAFPLGSFRTDFFLVAYIVPIAAFAFERSEQRSHWWDLVPATVLLVVPLLVFEKDWHADKTYFSWRAAFPQTFSTLLMLMDQSGQTARGTLALDGRSCTGWNYYSKYNPAFMRDVAPKILKRLEPRCVDAENERAAIAALFHEIPQDEGPEAGDWFALFADQSLFQYAKRTVPRDHEVVSEANIGRWQFVLGIKRKP